jgi:SAM-dependent methyltransferase
VKGWLWHVLAVWASRFMIYVNRHILRRRLRGYTHLANGRLLDIGAGDKPYRSLFAVDEYVGVNARKFYIPVIPGAVSRHTDVWIDDATALPFADAAFDAVVCFQVLSVIDEPGRVFAEVARVLKAGGALLLTTDFLYPKWAAEDRFRYTDVGLRALAQAQGFDVVAVESLGGWLALVHCLAMRYVRDYPGRVRAAPTRLRCLGRWPCISSGLRRCPRGRRRGGWRSSPSVTCGQIIPSPCTCCWWRGAGPTRLNTPKQGA